MEVTFIFELIQSLGFPTAVCVGLFWLNRETTKHYERVLMELKDALNNLSETIRK